MWERFGKLAFFFAFLAAIVTVIGAVMKRYYSLLGEASDEYDEGDELSDDIVETDLFTVIDDEE
jgi:hypothetical protein